MNKAINLASEELGFSKEVVVNVYRAYWKFIREHIVPLPLKEDLSEKEFNTLKKNFNLAGLGKLSCNWDNYKAIKNNYNNKQNDKYKKDKTSE